jgi:cell shape-determining protein MreC
MHELSAYFLDRRTLADDRDRLTAENNALRSANRALATQVTDVTRLVGGRTEAAHRILAGILARPPVTPYDTLVLDRGEEDGVVVGSIVYAPGNVPLGTIESSTKKTARAALYSAGGRITEGWIGEKRVAISLVGHGAGTFSATLPRESMAQVGDTVYIPGPGALPIGTIVRIDTNPSSPSDTIHISPFTNLFSLTWVEVSQGS